MALNTLTNLKDAYDLKFTDEVIQRALNYGHEQLLKRCYKRVEVKSNTPDTTFLLDKNIARITEVADPSDTATNVVTATDINLLQISETDYDVGDKNSNIASVYPNHPRKVTVVTTDVALPESTKELFWEYYILNKPWTLARETVMEIERILSMIQIFSTTDKSNLQTGIGSWTLNGVSVDFNSVNINEYVAQIETYVNRLIFGVKAAGGKTIAISKEYRDSNYIIDESGNYRRRL